ncbi:tellurite resistance/C4-dicarboxylate transporter family protein [Isoptericola sp. NEAU-Y5]|uniref:Tellurite resistance/C4-dicarboxylate transporter family protein n=1 Tax=Isoptericola luteus TaxID=2879484 RepID=A0ABS7ZJG2_9MICO|nr:tellurite resistance/C4-dicarboxylate transporter family protein [Isoptericola sp. NEAU-Y5]MCA5895166.1 tellurite resistance/C4-dicarboxylate transporter family protein [Isoptericola sp. NEAU-Y5]
MSRGAERWSAALVRTLFPGIFAMVMATGIIAIGAGLLGLRWLALGLHGIAAVMYVVLTVLVVARAVTRPRELWKDLTSHARGFAFLTIVAGTGVLADGIGLLYGRWGVTAAFGVVGTVLWFVLVYVVLVATIVGQTKPGLERGINGTWFLLTVSTQSLAVLMALLLGRAGEHSDMLAFGAVAVFMLGVLLYVIVMTMVFLRWTFLRLTPDEADPPVWIAAGALAITVLAGSNLMLAADGSSRIAGLLPFLEGIVIMAWGTSTFWFPLMIAISVWRHLVRRLPLRYHPANWSMVFPIGMYGVATIRMRDAIDLEPLGWVAPLVLALALAAWLPTFVGMLRRLVVGRRSGTEAVSAPA